MKKRKLAFVIHAVTNELIKKGCIQIDTSNRLEINDKKEDLTFFEQIIYNYIQEQQTVYYTDLVNNFIYNPVFTQISNFADALKKVFFSSKIYLKYHIIKTTIFYMILLFGISRLFLGIERNKSVGYLIVILIIFLIGHYFYNLHVGELCFSKIIPQYYRTNETRIFIKQDKSKYLGWEYLTVGDAVIVGSFVPVITLYERKQHKDGSIASGCSSGCSSGGSCGSSCGGGCGGCGG